MPEGDTIARTAEHLRRWLRGRVVTAARDVVGARAERLVGCTVAEVTARGKHLLIHFTPPPEPSGASPAQPRAAGSTVGPSDRGLALHTHMQMTGSWHVYRTTDRWRRPERQARIVLECGDRLAVCFNAPVVSLVAAAELERDARLGALGPDVLVLPLDLEEVARRVSRHPPARAVGEALLDQRIVCGIGNIYRCEALFLCGVHPWTPLGGLAPDTFSQLCATASRLMLANLGEVGRDLGAGPDRTWVYRRAGRPCRRCSAAVRSRSQGAAARTAYWCPVCQPEVAR